MADPPRSVVAGGAAYVRWANLRSGCIRSLVMTVFECRHRDDGAGSREETAMKCSNPKCGHGIGLVSYQRHWFDKRRFCSKKRNVGTISRLRGADPASRNASSAATSIGYWQTPRRKLLRATIRGNWRKRALQRIGGRPRSSVRIRVESPMSALGQKQTCAPP
jgi:hypothetical protein